MESFTKFHVKEGADTIGVLEDSHFSSEPCIDATEFKADNSTANHSHPGRDLFEGESASGAHNILLIKLKARCSG